MDPPREPKRDPWLAHLALRVSFLCARHRRSTLFRWVSAFRATASCTPPLRPLTNRSIADLLTFLLSAPIASVTSIKSALTRYLGPTRWVGKGGSSLSIRCCDAVALALACLSWAAVVCVLCNADGVRLGVKVGRPHGPPYSGNWSNETLEIDEKLCPR